MNELLISRLRAARIDKNMTQQEVANILGIKPNTLSNWEKGRTEPDIDTFVKLCDIYEIDCASLLNDVYAFKRVKSDISLSEYEYIKKYRNLDDHGKDLVNTILEKENTRCIDFAISKTNNPPLFIENDAATSPIDRLTAYANAAHAIPNASLEDKQHDEDIMDDPDF